MIKLINRFYNINELITPYKFDEVINALIINITKIINILTSFYKFNI